MSKDDKEPTESNAPKQSVKRDHKRKDVLFEATQVLPTGEKLVIVLQSRPHKVH